MQQQKKLFIHQSNSMKSSKENNITEKDVPKFDKNQPPIICRLLILTDNFFNICYLYLLYKKIKIYRFNIFCIVTYGLANFIILSEIIKYVQLHISMMTDTVYNSNNFNIY